jgi:hypothetical protein
VTDPWRASKDVVHHMQDQLAQYRAGAGPSADATPPEPPSGVGEAMDGKIRVELTGGRVSALHIDPAALRIPAGELSTVIMEAANAALDAMRAAMTASLPSPPSLDQMTRTLNEISADSFRALDKTTEGVRRSMDAVRRISEQHRKRH